jgi:multidrug resistance efflux pump
MSPPPTEPSTRTEHRLPEIGSDGLPGTGLVHRAVGAIFSMLALVVVLAALVASFVQMDVTISGSGVIEPVAIWPVRSQEAGLISRVLVSTGDTVSEGEATVQLDSLPLQTTLLQLQAQYEALWLEHQRATAAEPIEERRQEELTNQAQARLVRARASLRQKLVDFGFGGDVDSVVRVYTVGEHVGVDLALADVMSAEADVRSSVAQWELLVFGELDQQAQRARLRRLEQQMSNVRLRLKRLSISAPAAGIVLTEQLEQLPGRYLREGEQVLEVAAVGRWRAILVLRERDVHRVTVGDVVKLEVAAFAGIVEDLIGGRVVSVASDQMTVGAGLAVSSQTGLYRVIADLDQDEVDAIGSSRLRRGFSVQGKVITRSGRIVTLLWAYLNEKLGGTQ